MARVTVEDCILNIPNRFDLVIVASQRAKQIASGTPLTIDRDNDKDPVVSLRELAERSIDKNVVLEEIVQSFQKRQAFDPNDRLEDEDALPSIYGHGNSDISREFEEANRHMQEQQDQRSYGGLSFIEDNIEVED